MDPWMNQGQTMHCLSQNYVPRQHNYGYWFLYMIEHIEEFGFIANNLSLNNLS